MPQFTPDTTGVVVMHDPAFAYVTFDDHDGFTQSYIEAVFFTDGGSDGELGNLGYADFAPETLKRIVEDCRDFQASEAWVQFEARPLRSLVGSRARAAGHDFWLTRNGHGAGFWDGDWPEPYAAALDAAARSFPTLEAYVGDDGLIYFA